MVRDIWIFGAGGHAREIMGIISEINEISNSWRCKGFVVDREYEVPTSLNDLPTVRGIEALSGGQELSIAVAIGRSKARQVAVQRLLEMEHFSFPGLVHPRAWVSPNLALGIGTIVFPGAMINTDV